MPQTEGCRAAAFADAFPPRVVLSEALVEAPEFPRIRIVRDMAVLRQIGEMRHRQYVERQGKNYAALPGLQDCLVEEIDAFAVNIYAEDATGITCAMRINDLADPRHPQLCFFRTLAGRLGIDERTALSCSRLVRALEHNGRHVPQLIDFVRLQTVRAGWRYCIMQTAERLIPFFHKFEFHDSGISSIDPVAGRLQVLVLDTRNTLKRRRGASK
jgi:hypothetical protein